MKKVEFLFIVGAVSFLWGMGNIYAYSGTINSVSVLSKCVALTFDDGPSPCTLQILKTLSKHEARATFFVIGQMAQSYPEIVRETARLGHEVGNHSWSHLNLGKSGLRRIEAELNMTQEAIARIIGIMPKVFRPPYDSFDSRVLSLAEKMGLATILWSVDPVDWRDPSPQVIAGRILGKVSPGDIVLLHDNHRNTMLALPIILEGLEKKGLRCVTVSELIKIR